MSIARQTGKALSTETPLLTVDGWSTMGDVQVGDRVFHPSGQAVKVTEVHPVIYGHDCYEVITTDDRRVIADADHLWTVRDSR